MENKINQYAKFQRQSDLVDADKIANFRVRIIGCGAIGSMAGLLLAKMGVQRFELWDPDTIEVHNLPNQFFPDAHLGKKKVDSLKETLESYGASRISTMGIKYDPSCPHMPVDCIICAVDSMDFRKKMFDKLKLVMVPLYMEARMGGMEYRLYTLQNNNTKDKQFKFYEETLYSDDQATPAPCTSKSTIFTTALIGSLICNNVRQFLKEGKVDPFEQFGQFSPLLHYTNTLEDMEPPEEVHEEEESKLVSE